jgi:ABC-2 type transport system ATP-binding protein
MSDHHAPPAAATSRPAIEALALRKEYGPKVAVESLNLTVERGEVFGFLGPNGAGKTTSIKMLLGLAQPTSGTGRLLGTPIGDPESRRQVGFLPEHFRFHEWLRADEFLDLHGKLLDVPPAARRQRIPELLALVGLSDAAQRHLSTYSKGMLQRIGLAQALINEPALVFLDEPTSGLDPLGRRMVRDIIRHLRERGTTVFLNSHLLSEVEITCTRVAFVAAGRVRQVLTLGDRQGELMQVELRVGAVDEALLAGLRRWSEQIEVDATTHTVTLRLASEHDLPEIARWIVGQGRDLYGLTQRTLSLEDLFVSIVGDEPCETS